MTISPNGPLEYEESPGDDELDGTTEADLDSRPIQDETELSGSGGYDDRQEGLQEADADLFHRKTHGDPDADYKPEDEPRSEPRKQPRQQ